VWSWVTGAVLLAIVIGWGFVDLAGRMHGDKTLGSFNRSNQQSGQSVTARQGPVVPKSDSSTRQQPQNTNENARVIDQGSPT
jgi:hypothetical protein